MRIKNYEQHLDNLKEEYHNQKQLEFEKEKQKKIKFIESKLLDIDSRASFIIKKTSNRTFCMIKNYWEKQLKEWRLKIYG